MKQKLSLPLAAKSMNIFLTGATGTLGGELTARLAAAGHSVVALVRSARDIYANDGRLLVAEEFAGAMPTAGSVAMITGDIISPSLGLKKSDAARLQRDIDLVIHCAAITDFNASDAVYENVNINGVAHLLDLLPDARLLHISTAYVCGLKDGPIAEIPCAAQHLFSNGYERSKAAGEALVLAANRRAVIARPSIIVGAYNDGAIYRFDTFYQFFRLIAEGHITQLPVTTKATLDFVPIDHVVGGLMDIVEYWEKAEGQIVHLTSGTAIPADMLAEAINLFDHLNAPELVCPEAFAVENLPKMQRRLYKRFAAFYSGYLQRHPDFATENLRAISGRSCPRMDFAAIERLIKYCIENDFIRSKQASKKVA